MMLKESKRIVFKFGTNILRNKQGEMAYERIESFIKDIANLKGDGKEIIIITSGAVGLGAKKLNLRDTKKSLFDKQACASVGQAYVMRMWERGFQTHNITVAQILLTEDDFSKRSKYLCLRNTLSRLLELNVIPIINQNDVVSSCELDSEVCFSDNDKLSALVASKLDADLLVIVSDIDGLFDKNPKEFKDAKLINKVKGITQDILKLAKGATLGGRGGMQTKLEAAKVVTRSGAVTIIVNGLKENVISKAFEDDNASGTTFLPTETLSGKKRWLAYATNVKGSIYVNRGAKEALIVNQTSLLPIGVIDVENSFSKGDVVSIKDEEGLEFARGISVYNSTEINKIKGLHSDKIESILGQKISDDIVIKDNLVLL